MNSMEFELGKKNTSVFQRSKIKISRDDKKAQILGAATRPPSNSSQCIYCIASNYQSFYVTQNIWGSILLLIYFKNIVSVIGRNAL